MPDNNLPVMPTHVDDYQPPQVADPAMNVPVGFNPPPAPSFGQNSASVTDVSSMPTPVVSAPTASGDDAVMVTSINGKTEERQLSAAEKALYSAGQKPAALDQSAGSSADVQPVAPAQPAVSSSSPSAPSTSPNQSLEAQNIFDLLGVSDGKQEEKDAFLDELQDVIWEDFLAHDVELLLSSTEITSLNEIKAKGHTPEVQEEILVFLEKLIPDLEDMMMDKAIELKEDMVMERIAGLREFHAQNASALEQIMKAEQLISEGLWADASQILNSIK